ncbi:uracil-DNA glycosylase [Paraburkholderia rhizosphaerae]|uniref:Type-4 uracil-DNA glycosylase n=1 Tax=Paraburkholderia rhizosphaerae TaxID=480658 RepID=A0A4R8LG57_9BURK|nr:uracil-DNA glycosylase [Paraburkholderia rhizosphaerae]TDY42101.1 DNA polymerase [Paraburkholderia rhizosphaerae]
MALHESALEELGLAPRWVRRGGATGLAMPQDGDDDATTQAVAADVVAGTHARPEAARSETMGSEATRSEAMRREAVRTEGPRAGAAGAAAPHAEASSDVTAAPLDAGFGAKFEAGSDTVRPDHTGSGAALDAQPASAVPRDGSHETPRSQPDREERNAATARSEPAASAASAEDDFAWFDELPAQPSTRAPARADEAAPHAADDVAAPAVSSLDWDALAARVAGCERCRLCEKRTQTVFGVGDRDADWMLIGEAPGENEDRQGEPFVGQAGKLLDNMLRSVSLERGANVYIANVLKCRPPGNRNPEPDEVARCEPYLQRQVALVKPKVIVALGRFAAQSLLKTDASISSLRGRMHVYEGVPVIVTYHPAYLLRSLHDKAKAWQDLCLARDTWRSAAAGATPGASPENSPAHLTHGTASRPAAGSADSPPD